MCDICVQRPFGVRPCQLRVKIRRAGKDPFTKYGETFFLYHHPCEFGRIS